MVNEKKTRTYKEQEFIYQSQINAVSTISTTVQKKLDLQRRIWSKKTQRIARLYLISILKTIPYLL